MKKWRCSVCGYIHEGDEPPAECPNCKAPKEKFGEIADDFEMIHMHHGVKFSYGKNVEVNPFFGNYTSLSPYIYNLPAGQKVGLHKHPTTDEFFFILKGEFNFRVGDREFIAVPGDVVQGLMNVPHAFENISDEPGAFLSVKGPKPVDLERLE